MAAASPSAWPTTSPRMTPPMAARARPDRRRGRRHLGGGGRAAGRPHAERAAAGSRHRRARARRSPMCGEISPHIGDRRALRADAGNQQQGTGMRRASGTTSAPKVPPTTAPMGPAARRIGGVMRRSRRPKRSATLRPSGKHRLLQRAAFRVRRSDHDKDPGGLAAGNIEDGRQGLEPEIGANRQRVAAERAARPEKRIAIGGGGRGDVAAFGVDDRQRPEALGLRHGIPQIPPCPPARAARRTPPAA